MPNLLLTMWDTIKSSNIGILVAAGLGMFAIIGGLSMLSYHYTLGGIKSRTVGDGQHGTARWATDKEIKQTYDITADELLAGTDTAKTESKTAQAQMLILELLADGKRMPSAELEKTVNERGISSRTMRTAKSRIGDRLVTEKDGTAWVCYLRD